MDENDVLSDFNVVDECSGSEGSPEAENKDESVDTTGSSDQPSRKRTEGEIEAFLNNVKALGTGETPESKTDSIISPTPIQDEVIENICSPKSVSSITGRNINIVHDQVFCTINNQVQSGESKVLYESDGTILKTIFNESSVSSNGKGEHSSVPPNFPTLSADVTLSNTSEEKMVKPAVETNVDLRTFLDSRKRGTLISEANRKDLRSRNSNDEALSVAPGEPRSRGSSRMARSRSGERLRSASAISRELSHISERSRQWTRSRSRSGIFRRSRSLSKGRSFKRGRAQRSLSRDSQRTRRSRSRDEQRTRRSRSRDSDRTRRSRSLVRKRRQRSPSRDSLLALRSSIRDRLKALRSPSRDHGSIRRSTSRDLAKRLRSTSRDRLMRLRSTSRDRLKRLRSTSRDRERKMRSPSRDYLSALRSRSRDREKSLRSTSRDSDRRKRSLSRNRLLELRSKIRDRLIALRSTSRDRGRILRSSSRDSVKRLRSTSRDPGRSLRSPRRGRGRISRSSSRDHRRIPRSSSRVRGRIPRSSSRDRGRRLRSKSRDREGSWRRKSPRSRSPRFRRQSRERRRRLKSSSRSPFSLSPVSLRDTIPRKPVELRNYLTEEGMSGTPTQGGFPRPVPHPSQSVTASLQSSYSSENPYTTGLQQYPGSNSNFGYPALGTNSGYTGYPQGVPPPGYSVPPPLSYPASYYQQTSGGDGSGGGTAGVGWGAPPAYGSPALTAQQPPPVSYPPRLPADPWGQAPPLYPTPPGKSNGGEREKRKSSRRSRSRSRSRSRERRKKKKSRRHRSRSKESSSSSSSKDSTKEEGRRRRRHGGRRGVVPGGGSLSPPPASASLPEKRPHRVVIDPNRIPTPPPPPILRRDEDRPQGKDTKPIATHPSKAVESAGSVSLSSLLEAVMETSGEEKSKLSDPNVKKQILSECETKIRQLYKKRTCGLGAFMPEPIQVRKVNVRCSPLALFHPHLTFNGGTRSEVWHCPSIKIPEVKLVNLKAINPVPDPMAAFEVKELPAQSNDKTKTTSSSTPASGYSVGTVNLSVGYTGPSGVPPPLGGPLPGGVPRPVGPPPARPPPVLQTSLPALTIPAMNQPPPMSRPPPMNQLPPSTRQPPPSVMPSSTPPAWQNYNTPLQNYTSSSQMPNYSQETSSYHPNTWSTSYPPSATWQTNSHPTQPPANSQPSFLSQPPMISYPLNTLKNDCGSHQNWSNFASLGGNSMSIPNNNDGNKLMSRNATKDLGSPLRSRINSKGRRTPSPSRRLAPPGLDRGSREGSRDRSSGEKRSRSRRGSVEPRRSEERDPFGRTVRRSVGRRSVDRPVGRRSADRPLGRRSRDKSIVAKRSQERALGRPPMGRRSVDRPLSRRSRSRERSPPTRTRPRSPLHRPSERPHRLSPRKTDSLRRKSREREIAKNPDPKLTKNTKSNEAKSTFIHSKQNPNLAVAVPFKATNQLPQPVKEQTNKFDESVVESCAESDKAGTNPSVEVIKISSDEEDSPNELKKETPAKPAEQVPLTLRRLCSLGQKIRDIQEKSTLYKGIIMSLVKNERTYKSLYAIYNHVLCKIGKTKAPRVVFPRECMKEFLLLIHNKFHDVNLKDFVHGIQIHAYPDSPIVDKTVSKMFVDCPRCKIKPVKVEPLIETKLVKKVVKKPEKIDKKSPVKESPERESIVPMECNITQPDIKKQEDADPGRPSGYEKSTKSKILPPRSVRNIEVRPPKLIGPEPPPKISELGVFSYNPITRKLIGPDEPLEFRNNGSKSSVAKNSLDSPSESNSKPTSPTHQVDAEPIGSSSSALGMDGSSSIDSSCKETGSHTREVASCGSENRPKDCPTKPSVAPRTPLSASSTSQLASSKPAASDSVTQKSSEPRRGVPPKPASAVKDSPRPTRDSKTNISKVGTPKANNAESTPAASPRRGDARSAPPKSSTPQSAPNQVEEIKKEIKDDIKKIMEVLPGATVNPDSKSNKPSQPTDTVADDTKSESSIKKSEVPQPKNNAGQDFKTKIRSVQMKNKELGEIIYSLESKTKNVEDCYLLKAGMLCKKILNEGGSAEVKIIAPEDFIEEVIDVIHKMSSIHTPQVKLVAFFSKHFAPVEGIANKARDYVEKCQECKK